MAAVGRTSDEATATTPYTARKLETLLLLSCPPMSDKEATGHGVAADNTAVNGTAVTAPEPELYAVAFHVLSDK